jgi:hypothetical protein
LSPLMHLTSVPTSSNMFVDLSKLSGSTSAYNAYSSAANVLNFTGLSKNTVVNLTLSSKATGSYVASPTFTASGCTPVNYLNGDSTNNITAFTTTNYVSTIFIKMTTNTPYLTFVAPVVSGTATLDIVISVVPQSLVGFHSGLSESLDHVSSKIAFLEDRLRILSTREEYEEHKETPSHCSTPIHCEHSPTNNQ